MVLMKNLSGLAAAFLLLIDMRSACGDILPGGLDIGGGVTSGFIRSALSGSAAIDTNASNENVRASALDLDMRYRPMDSAQVRTLLRFYQDWRSFSSGNGRLASVRWLSADGKVADAFGFHVGDFHRKYSPLILWAPEAELNQEPEIFADSRATLMEERFLGGNERVLQGIDLDYGREFDLPVNRINMDAMFSRVRKAEYLDQNGAQGFGLARSDMDRFFLGLRAEASVRENLKLGASYHRLDDDRGTYALFMLSPKTRQAAYGNLLNTGLSLNGGDSVLSRNLGIEGLQGSLDLAGFLRRPHLILSISADFARSVESNRLAWSYRTDTLAGIVKNVPITVPKTGTTADAMHIDITGGWRDSSSGNSYRITARYLSNGQAFLNPMAQTPTFVPTRILNTENDQSGGGLYTTFDALYNGVYRFTPSRQAQGNQQAAYTKNAYNGSIWSPEDLRAFHGDPVVQLELPFGLATPNRSGFMGNLEGEWHHAVHMDLAGAGLHEIEGGTGKGNGAIPLPATRFYMGSLGMRVDWDQLFALRRPFHVNGSYTVRGSTRSETATDSVSPDQTVYLWMGGLRYQGFDKWAFLAGIQSAGLNSPSPLLHPLPGDTANTNHVRQTANERQWKVGIEYALTNRAHVMASGGLISMDIREAASASAPGSGGSTQFTQSLLQLEMEIRL